MELLDNEDLDDVEIFEAVVCSICDEAMLETDFIDHVVEQHPYRLVGLIKETVIIEKLTTSIELKEI